jgi:hypothetical protein
VSLTATRKTRPDLARSVLCLAGMETVTITATSGPAFYDEVLTMATTMETHETTQEVPEINRLEAGMCPLRVSDESGGYIVYLTERQLLKAYPRAKRENPDAVVHFERHDDDLWSLEVYMSEAAKDAYLISRQYREKALSTLSIFHGPGRASDA